MQTINDSDLLKGIYAVVDWLYFHMWKKSLRHSDWLYKFFSYVQIKRIDLYK